MKKGVRSYLAFTSLSYRIWGLVILPAVFLVAAYFAFTDITEDIPWGFYLGGSVVLAFEIFSDLWMFGGCCRSQDRQMEYLMTSHRGFTVFKNALVVDLIRRFLYIMIFTGVCSFKSGRLADWCAGLALYLLSVGVLNLTRYFSGVIQQMMAAVLAATLFGILGMVTQGRGGILELIVLVMADVAVSVVTLRHALYRMKGCYYERETDEGN